MEKLKLIEFVYYFIVSVERYISMLAMKEGSQCIRQYRMNLLLQSDQVNDYVMDNQYLPERHLASNVTFMGSPALTMNICDDLYI